MRIAFPVYQAPRTRSAAIGLPAAGHKPGIAVPSAGYLVCCGPQVHVYVIALQSNIRTRKLHSTAPMPKHCSAQGDPHGLLSAFIAATQLELSIFATPLERGASAWLPGWQQVRRGLPCDLQALLQ